MPQGENNRKLSNGDIDEIVRRYITPLPDGTWLGTSTLAREFGVRPATINRWLRLRCVTVRTAREAHSGGKRCKPITNLPQGEPPTCKCGCGAPVDWNQRKNRWNAYAFGHYVSHPRRQTPPEPRPSLPSRMPPPYADPDLLRRQYVDEQMSLAEMGRHHGVTACTISRYMDRAGIPRRARTDARSGGRRVGALNAAWKGGVAKWDYSSDWKALARDIRSRDEWTCQDCGERRMRWGAGLHVHHVDEDKLNNDPANLVSLCARCHRQRHRASATQA